MNEHVVVSVTIMLLISNSFSYVENAYKKPRLCVNEKVGLMEGEREGKRDRLLRSILAGIKACNHRTLIIRTFLHRGRATRNHGRIVAGLLNSPAVTLITILCLLLLTLAFTGIDKQPVF